MTNDLEDALKRRLRGLGADIDAAPDLEERIAHKRVARKRHRFHQNIAAISAAVVAVAVVSVSFAVSGGRHSQRVTTASTTVTATPITQPAGSGPAAGDVVNEKFTRTVILDGGVLTIRPAPSTLEPPLPEAQAKVLVASDSQVYNESWNGSLGFGEVSITPTLTAGAENIPAWVALIEQSAPFCPYMASPSTPATTGAPQEWSPGYLAVIVEGNGTTVLDYHSRSQVCDAPATGPSVNDATWLASIPWQMVSLHGQTLTFRYQKPACDPDAVGASGPSLAAGGNAKTGQWNLEALIEAPYNLTYSDLTHCGGPWTTTSTQIGPIPGGPGPPSSPEPTVVTHALTGPVGATT